MMENELRKPLLDDELNSQSASITKSRSEETTCGTVTESSNDGFPGDGRKKVRWGQNEVSTWWMNLYRPEIRYEVKMQLELALPMVVVHVCQSSILVVPLAFVGRCGEVELASAALATSIASVCGLYIMMGMASALETLCGQAYGAQQYHMVEIYFQRAVFVLFCVCVPLTVGYLNIERLLLLLGQAPEISAKSAEYVVCLIPMLYAIAILEPLVKFLQTQSIVKPMVYCGAGTLAMHVGLCWFMVNFLEMGYIGGAVATSTSLWLNVLFLLAYVTLANSCEKTSVIGFSKEALTDLGSFLKLALSSTFMICLEYWCFEIMVLAAGMLPDPALELSGLSICLNTMGLTYTIPLGLSAAASTRVSNELGARKADAARRAVLMALIMSSLQSLVFSMTFFFARHVWGSIFTKDHQVVDYVATILPFVSGICIIDGFQVVLSGAIRGAGWQGVAALINLAAFYGVGLPVGLVSAFVLGWGGKGLLTGLMLGLASQAIVLGVLTLRTNWEEEAESAYNRQIPTSVSKGEVDV